MNHEAVYRTAPATPGLLKIEENYKELSFIRNLIVKDHNYGANVHKNESFGWYGNVATLYKQYFTFESGQCHAMLVYSKCPHI